MSTLTLHRWRFPVSLALCGLATTPLACHKDASPQQVTATAASAAGPASKAAPLSDADIVQAIQRHFKDEGLLRSAPLTVAVTQGVAMLSGSVGSLLAKERAVAVAETIRGVRSVIDTVAVTPVARSDDQLKSDVMAALRRDAATRPYKITAAASGGTVTLTGAADSWQQKALLGEVAKTVPGVKSVANDVVVHYAVDRPESETLADIKHRIGNDVWLDRDALDVTVTGHTAHLTGVVASAAQRSRARSDAWVAGVETVDDSGIIVDWAMHNDQKRVIEYPVRTDPEIAQALRDAFRLDPRLRTLVPQVAVQSGTVTLTGNVDSAAARRAAVADARDTLGVWGVRNEVLVQPNGKPMDADIERSVKRELSRDLLLSDAKDIQVSSAKGKVALKGTIASGFERFDVIEDVGSVPGVSEIDDGLVVKRPPADIKASVEDRLFWDPRVERDRVSVAVGPDGVATLTGTLDAWSEIKAAGEDAFWGGGARVINLLKLKNHPEVVAP